MSSQPNGTLYVGATSDLVKRVWEHKNKVVSVFSAKYQVHDLDYYEFHHTIVEATRRERRLKHWCRQWKLNLIEGFNPTWRDLYQVICA